MNTPSVKEQLIAKLDQLTDDEIRELIEHIDIVKYKVAMQSDELPADYSIENDPLVGFLSGTTDLAERIREILYQDIDPLSGWTEKKDNT